MGAILFFCSFIAVPIAVIWALYKFFDAIFYRIEKHYGISRWASAKKYNEPDDYDYGDFWAICFIFATVLFFYYR